MDEDQILQSIIADPQLTDPSIDTSGLRTTTPTRTELLANVPEFSGLKYDFTNRDYIRDLYSIYGGGLPTIPEPVVEDTAQIPGAVDTLVDVGGGGGQDQVTGGLDTPTITTPTVTEPIGGGADMATLPATTVTTPTDTSIAIEDFTTPFVTERGITGGPVEYRDQTQITDPVTPIQDLPMVTTSINPATGEVFDAQTEEEIGNLYDEVALTGASPEQQNLISQAFSKVGSTASDIMNDLSQIPGAIADFAKQTVDIAGQKINVGGTLLRAGINRIAGGPISLVFDALQAIAPQDSLANTTTRSIVDELKAEKDYGFNIQSGNLNQDPFGRNPVSGFGNYEQTLLDDIAGINQTGFQTAEMREAKKEFAQDYFDKKAGKTAPQEDIGATDSLDQLQAAEEATEREAFADIQNQIGQTRDQDPAPAPPAPAPSYNYSGGGGRDSGGGGGGSPGSAGPGGSDEMGSF